MVSNKNYRRYDAICAPLTLRRVKLVEANDNGCSTSRLEILKDILIKSFPDADRTIHPTAVFNKITSSRKRERVS